MDWTTFLNWTMVIAILVAAIALPIAAYLRDRTSINLADNPKAETEEQRAQLDEIEQNVGEPKLKTFWALMLSLAAILSFVLTLLLWNIPPVGAIYIALTVALLILLIEASYISKDYSSLNKLFVVAYILLGVAIVCFIAATILFHTRTDGDNETDTSKGSDTSTSTTPSEEYKTYWEQITEGIGDK